MDRVERWLREVEATHHDPVSERVTQLLEAVRRGSERHEGESWDQANERHAEEFISHLAARYGARVHIVPRGSDGGSSAGAAPAEAAVPDAPPAVIVERQKLRPMARRTTGYNYIFTVPGRRPERLILVAHYDTWRGPGADDNTTGEEITKQYLLADLDADRPPPLTHTYILAGSEECGLIGFTSQVLLALGIGVANLALAKGIYVVTAIGLALVPLANFRFGVSGSREYVQSLSREEMARIQSVISVDSVGEGRMYIPESSLGADFVRAFLPFEGYEALNDVLEEAAHLNGVKYNNFIAGGTTDHISFLEVNSTFRDRLGDWLGCPRWLGCHRHGARKIPAAALVALNPGKASPLVFGGKIHTPNDTPDRVYPGPLAEALRILDYWFHLMHGGARIAEPRRLDEYHYAQLFEVESEAPDSGGRTEHWLALKDAVEPNRRNINGVYRVRLAPGSLRDAYRCAEPALLGWGVETKLGREAEKLAAANRRVRRVDAAGLTLERADGAALEFRANRRLARPLLAAAEEALGRFERFMGTNTFLTFFAAAFALAKGVDLGMTFLFAHSMAFQEWFFKWFAATLPLTIIAQLGVVLWLIGKKIPTMIDNSYKHLNRADNLRSLRRTRS
jgi:hypothetical protein